MQTLSRALSEEWAKAKGDSKAATNTTTSPCRSNKIKHCATVFAVVALVYSIKWKRRGKNMNGENLSHAYVTPIGRGASLIHSRPTEQR